MKFPCFKLMYNEAYRYFGKSIFQTLFDEEFVKLESFSRTGKRNKALK